MMRVENGPLRNVGAEVRGVGSERVTPRVL